MKKKLILSLALFGVVSTNAWAQEESEAAADELADLPKVQTNAPVARVFTALPLVKRVEGQVQVRKPGGDWEAAEEGRFYPFGSSYRTLAGARLSVAFGQLTTVELTAESEFAVRNQGMNVKSRTLVPVKGTMMLKLPSNMPAGMFFVAAPSFLVKNPTGESKITYFLTGDGDEANVRCVTGSFGIEGHHFDIPTMEAADEIRIRDSADHLQTILHGVTGDYSVKVDQGVQLVESFNDDGQKTSTVEKRVFDWHLTPLTRLIITRMVPAIGERMSVHTMAFDATGTLKSECCFCEGRTEVNSGELVPVSKASKEEIAKKAAAMAAEETAEAEATETTESETTSEEEE